MKEGRRISNGAVLGWEVLYMLCITLAAAGGAALQYVGRIEAGDDKHIIFSGTLYRYNLFFYLMGLLIFVSVIALFYTKIFSKKLAGFGKRSIWIKIAYIMIDLLFSFVMLAAMVFEALMILGLNDDMLPQGLFFVTGFIWPTSVFVYMLLIMVAAMRRNADE